jgi:carotenoid cleavage dioxygenase-like enzyme
VQKLGDQLIAMTESPLPIVFDRATLNRAGTAYEAPGQLTIAHPHYERGTGALLNYAAHLGVRSHYRLFRVAADARRAEQLAEVPVREPSYMHSFGITEHFFVLSEFPFVVNPLHLALSNQPFIANYRWKPERGTRFTVIDRRDGTVRARLHGPACFGFHHINAFEQGSNVIVDISVADDATLIDELSRRSVMSAAYPGGGALRSGTIRAGERGTTHYRRRSCGAGLLLTCAGSAARLSPARWSRGGARRLGRVVRPCRSARFDGRHQSAGLEGSRHDCC